MTTHWPLAALTILGSVGLGIYLTATIGYFKRDGGEIRPPLLIFIAILLLLAPITATISLGNPSRIANILGHPQSGFSIAMLGCLSLAFISLFLLRFVGRENNGVVKNAVIIIGVAVAFIICYGILMMHMKPSRPAIYTWSVPLYLLSFAASSGIFGYSAVSSFCQPAKGNGLRAGKYVALLLQAVAVIGFMVNLNSIGVADKTLTLDLLLNGGLSFNFYGMVLIIGLALPAVFEFVASRKQDDNRIFQLLAFIMVSVGGVGFSIILSASASYIRKLIWP